MFRNIPIFTGSEDTNAVLDAATGTGNGSTNSSTDANGASGNGAAGHVVPPGASNTDNGNQSTTVSQDDYNRLQERMKQADRNRSDAQKALDAANAKVKEFEDKDRTDLEKAQRDAKEATERADKAESDVQEAKISNAFLSLGKYVWHNPGAALKLLDRSEIKIADGKITGVAEAADALAKDNAYLVKSSTAEEDKDNDKSKDKDKDKDKDKQHKSGASTSGGNGQQSTSREETLKKFPQLRGRL